MEQYFGQNIELVHKVHKRHIVLRLRRIYFTLLMFSGTVSGLLVNSLRLEKLVNVF